MCAATCCVVWRQRVWGEGGGVGCGVWGVGCGVWVVARQQSHSIGAHRGHAYVCAFHPGAPLMACGILLFEVASAALWLCGSVPLPLPAALWLCASASACGSACSSACGSAPVTLPIATSVPPSSYTFVLHLRPTPSSYTFVLHDVSRFQGRSSPLVGCLCCHLHTCTAW